MVPRCLGQRTVEEGREPPHRHISRQRLATERLGSFPLPVLVVVFCLVPVPGPAFVVVCFVRFRLPARPGLLFRSVRPRFRGFGSFLLSKFFFLFVYFLVPLCVQSTGIHGCCNICHKGLSYSKAAWLAARDHVDWGDGYTSKFAAIRMVLCMFM